MATTSDEGKTREQLMAEFIKLRAEIERLGITRDTLRDVTEYKTTADDERLKVLLAAGVESERIGQLKDDFLANLSHELRAPINAILGWSQIIDPAKTNPAELAEGMAVIRKNARLQAQMISDLLDMSRVVSGKMRLDVQRVDLAAVIDAATATVKLAAEAKNIRVEKVIDPLCGPVTGDPNRLQQVVWNLLSNAVKFTKKGGKIQVILERVNSHLDLAISDNGEGIAPEFLPHVFERLSQGPVAIHQLPVGLGLGLAIVKSIVELHGGTVRVKSAGLGKGSTFIVSLPVSIMRSTPDAKQQQSPVAEGEQCPEFAPTLTGVSVLAVDDDPDALEIVRRVLTSCQAEVMVATSGAEALEMLKTLRPSIILADINMPTMNGYAMAENIRAMGKENGGNVPIVALTAMARSDDRRRAMLAGFDLHLAKPVEPAELVAVVGRLARRN